MQRREIITRIESVIGTCPDLSQIQVLLCGVGAREPNQKTDVEPNHMQMNLAIDFGYFVKEKNLNGCIQSSARNGRRTMNRPRCFSCLTANFSSLIAY